MALSPRAVALVLLGLVPVVIWPSGWTVRLWILGCLLVVGVDLLLAAPPAGIGLARRPLGQVRVGDPCAAGSGTPGSPLPVPTPTGSPSPCRLVNGPSCGPSWPRSDAATGWPTG